MNIAVVRIADLGLFPPAISLVRALLDLGHEVTLIANGTACLSAEVRSQDNLHLVELGARSTAKDRLVQIAAAPLVVRDYLRAHAETIDVLWTTTDISARAVGRLALEFTHVMQISELVEFTPAVLMHNIPLHSRVVPELARQAAAVVVPEYNRAHIQRAWWKLPRVPFVLPNKPYPDVLPVCDSNILPPSLHALMEDERRILMYQGVYAEDRSLLPYAEAVKRLGPNYTLYIMGRAQDAEGTRMLETLRGEYRDFVVDIGHVVPPKHLLYTRFGGLGLLPYEPGKGKQFSSLNGLYCAPNKIWEYSKFGLPMLGSNVPGLENILTQADMGYTTGTDPDCIVSAIERIWENYEYISRNSLNFYKTIDYRKLVSDVLDSAIRNS